MLYSTEISKIVRDVRKPFPFTVDIVEHPTYIELRVYENEILSKDNALRESAMAWLIGRRNAVRSLGIPCHVGGVAGDPPLLK